MAELLPTQDEAEWLEARRKGITASEIAIVMGLSPYSSPYALYHQKLGILPPDSDQAVFERGRVLEPYVVEKFAAAHPEFKVLGDGRQLYAHSRRLWQLATPDRELYGCTFGTENCPGYELLAVLETKTDDGSQDWGEPGTDHIPVHYRCQVIWQCSVMGVDEAHVSCLRIHDWRIRDYIVRMDAAAQDDLALMLDAARDFLDRIDRQEPPDVDWRPATAYALKQLHPSVEDRDAHIGRRLEVSYRAAVRRYKEAERRKDEMTNRLREAMGSAKRAVGYDAATGSPVVIATRQVYDLAAKTVERKASTVDKLLPVKPKKES